MQTAAAAPTFDDTSARERPNRLLIAVVQVQDAAAVLHRLTAEGFGATRVDAAGGFLRRENAVLLVGTRDERLPQLLECVRQCCRKRLDIWFPPIADGLIGFASDPVEVEVGGAVVFVLPIEHYELLRRVGAAAGQPVGAGAGA